MSAGNRVSAQTLATGPSRVLPSTEVAKLEDADTSQVVASSWTKESEASNHGATTVETSAHLDGEPVKRRRRSLLEHVVDCLGSLSRLQRREAIAKRLTQEQRLAVEHHLMMQKEVTQPVVTLQHSNSVHVAKSTGKTTRAPWTKTKKPSVARLPVKKQVLERPKGLGSHRKGAFTYYFASMGIDSLIIRGRSVKSRQAALEQLGMLTALKASIQEGCGSFDQRVRHAVKDLLAARAGASSLEESMQQLASTAGFTVSIRIATGHWLGRELYTPARGLQELDEILCARHRLQEARGRVDVGGRGLLYRWCPEKARATWARLRQVYLEVCGESQKHRLQALEKRTASRQATNEARARRHQELLAEKQLRHARRRLLREQSSMRHREKVLRQQGREAVAAAKRESRTLETLDRLIARWTPTNRKGKAATGAMKQQMALAGSGHGQRRCIETLLKSSQLQSLASAASQELVQAI